jgi:hypothetical protein
MAHARSLTCFVCRSATPTIETSYTSGTWAEVAGVRVGVPHRNDVRVCRACYDNHSLANNPETPAIGFGSHHAIPPGTLAFEEAFLKAKSLANKDVVEFALKCAYSEMGARIRDAAEATTRRSKRAKEGDAQAPADKP